MEYYRRYLPKGLFQVPCPLHYAQATLQHIKKECYRHYLPKGLFQAPCPQYFQQATLQRVWRKRFYVLSAKRKVTTRQVVKIAADWHFKIISRDWFPEIPSLVWLERYKMRHGLHHWTTEAMNWCLNYHHFNWTKRIAFYHSSSIIFKIIKSSLWIDRNWRDMCFRFFCFWKWSFGQQLQKHIIRR